jgi:transposase
VLRGPNPERDGVSAWRVVDVCAHAEEAYGVRYSEYGVRYSEYGVRYSEWGMARLLKRLGLSRQKTRPRHPQGSAIERAAFKKWTWREARRDRRRAPERAAAALVRG